MQVAEGVLYLANTLYHTAISASTIQNSSVTYSTLLYSLVDSRDQKHTSGNLLCPCSTLYAWTVRCNTNAVPCSILQCPAVYCSTLEYLVVRLQCPAGPCITLDVPIVPCSTLHNRVIILQNRAVPYRTTQYPPRILQYLIVLSSSLPLQIL